MSEHRAGRRGGCPPQDCPCGRALTTARWLPRLWKLPAHSETHNAEERAQQPGSAGRRDRAGDEGQPGAALPAPRAGRGGGGSRGRPREKQAAAGERGARICPKCPPGVPRSPRRPLGTPGGERPPFPAPMRGSPRRLRSPRCPGSPRAPGPAASYLRGAAVAELVGDRLDAPGPRHRDIAALRAHVQPHHRHGCLAVLRLRLGSGSASSRRRRRSRRPLRPARSDRSGVTRTRTRAHGLAGASGSPGTAAAGRGSGPGERGA